MLEANDKMIEVVITKPNDVRHYQKLGYKLPKEYDKYGQRYVTKLGTTITVKESDTPDRWLIGRRFGHLTVVSYDYQKSEQMHGKQRYTYWKCRCDCSDKLKSIRQKDLLDGTIVSCGRCAKNHSTLSESSLVKKRDDSNKIIPTKKINSRPPVDLSGRKFGRLTVVRQDLETPQKPNKNGGFRVRWWCKCSCGNPELKSVLAEHLKSGKIQSCGCLWKESISGENNWNWKGGATPEDRLIRVQEDYVHWRYNVFQRDNFRCQCCGAYGALNAHHLLSFSKYTELRFNVDNGITLCEECHAVACDNSFHKVYGSKNTTPEQLREYILNKSGKDIYITHPQIKTLLTQQSD